MLSAFRKRLPLAPRLSQSRQRQCFHRSHFGSRYKLGCCSNASLFFYLHCFANFLMRAHVCSVALTRCLLTLTTMWLAPFKVVSSQTASLFSPPPFWLKVQVGLLRQRKPFLLSLMCDAPARNHVCIITLKLRRGAHWKRWRAIMIAMITLQSITIASNLCKVVDAIVIIVGRSSQADYLKRNTAMDDSIGGS